MGKIQKIKDNNNVEIYPVTHERAVKDSSGVNLETKLAAKQDTISTVSVSVDGNTGTPSGTASFSNGTLSFSFSNLKGATGPAGVTSASVTVSNTTGTPSATATVSDGNLALAFTNIKGEQGPQGDPAPASAVEPAVDAWLEAHPEATTTVQDGSITQAKLAFPVIPDILSPNLIDTTTVTSARFTNTSGSVQSFTSGSYYNYWRMTDYIDVSQHIGEYISITNHNGYCFYNSSKQAISGSGESLGMNYPSNSSTDPILIPDGATYVKLVYWYRGDAVLTPMANYGQTLAEYSEYNSLSFPEGLIYNKNLGEKILYENIVHDKVVEYVIPNNILSGTTYKANYSINTSTGEEMAISSGYSSSLCGFVEVKNNTTYYGRIRKVFYYDKDKNYLTYTKTNGTAFTTPTLCKFIRCETPSDVYNHNKYDAVYLVEGSSRPDHLDHFDKHVAKADIEKRALYSSVLDRLQHLHNPTIKTVMSFVGDSNTYGLESGNTGVRLQNCWANLMCNKILSAFNREITLYPYGRWGTWCGEYYSGTTVLKSDNPSAFVSLDFYGEVLKVHFGTASKGTVNIVIDDGEPASFNSNTDGTLYEATGLEETSHHVLIYKTDSSPQISGITVRKYVTVTNDGVSGIGSSSCPSNDYTKNIFVIVLGTNDRGGSPKLESIENNFSNCIANQELRGNSVILITPTPATDGFERGTQTGRKMADIDQVIFDVCGYYNYEPLSFYQYLISYCRTTGTSLNSLLTDTLHIKESTHRMLYNWLCDKFGLGQDDSDLMPQ